MGRLFGTDGVRGLANRDVTAELALDLSVAAAHVLAASGAFESISSSSQQLRRGWRLSSSMQRARDFVHVDQSVPPPPDA